VSIHRPKRAVRRLALAALLALLGASALAAEPPVSWDLTEIYPTDDAWSESLRELAAGTAVLNELRGKLGSDAATLETALEEMFRLRMHVGRLAAYAEMRGDEDTREAGPQGMRQSMQSVFADLQAATAWIDPEILSIPSETIASYLAEEPGLAPYRRYLEQLEKRRPHTLDAEQEQLLGRAQRVMGVGAGVGNLLRNAEMPWKTITLSDGSELLVNAQGYVKGRALPNRADRIATYDAYYSGLQAFKASLAAALSATAQEHVFRSQVRHYTSSLEAAVRRNEVDPAVYRMLVDEINASLPTLHRYLKLRARILGIDDLRYHDMYPPLVDDITEDYSWETSKKIVAEALEPLGKEYVSRLNRAMNGGWIDVYPRPGKRSGAYVNDAAYEVHPYMLLNHQDDYASASTLAHEAGHLMHSWYSQEAQPYPTADYTIFVAEVASTVNQVMFFKHLVAEAADDDARLALLGRFLEELRTIVFRQTMFAEFELAMHERAERGEPLTGESLNAVYGDLLRRYHGEPEGVMNIDELYTAEWASVPHFHYDFYVYQYATSYIAATAIAEAIHEDREGARDRFLAFVRAGGTKPPVELLRDAGVDMTSPEPIRATMRLMNDVMDQIETILEKRD
jgi:oligoendopeptidase F